MPDPSEISDQLSLLYELSLSVGATLEPVENAAAFAETLAARTDLEGVAVWRWNEERTGLHLLHATPSSYVEADPLPADHALVQRLRADAPVSTHASDGAFASLTTGRGARGGALAAVRLGDLGVLEFHDSQREAAFPPRELRQLDRVLAKLEQALRGGRSHQQLEDEVERRVRTEEALRQPRSQLSALVQNLQDAVLLENEERELLLVNQAFCDLFEIPQPPAALAGADCIAAAEAAKSLFADPTVLTDRVDAILAAGRPVSAETLHLNDGRILERDYVPVDLDDETTGHLWTYRDVTEQRRLDARLQERERAYRRLVESASDIIYRCDPDGCFTYVNPVAAEATGYVRDELVGQPFTALVRPDHRERLVRFYRNQIEEEISDTRREFPIVTADGDELWLSQQVQLVREDGGIAGVQAIARDITERKQAEEALQKSEARFRTMFERHSAPMLLIDPESGAIRDANAAAETFYGYTDEEWAQLHIQDINDLPSEEVTTSRADAEEGEQNQFIFPHRLNSGEVRTVEVHSTPIEVHGTSMLFSIIHDITARAEARQKLRRSEERWRRLVESNRDPIQITVDGVIRYINPAGARIFGAETPEELIGRSTMDFSTEDDVLKQLRTRKKQIDRGEPTEPMEHTIQRLDGEERVIVSYSQPIEHRGETAAQTVIHDVTEQREAEEELRHLKTFYEQVLNAMPIDLSIFGPDGRYEYVTPTSVSDPEHREQIVGMTDVEYARMRGRDVETARTRLETIRRVAQTRETEQFEETIEGQNGNPRHFIRFVTPVVRDGSVINVLGYGLEITQRKQVEMQLRDAKEQAEASLAAKERFLATMSHEVRTPLNAVLGMAQLLARTDLTDTQRSYLQSIRFSADTLLTLLNTVLDFAKMEAEAGAVKLDRVAFSPAALARHVHRMLHSKATERGLDFRVEADPHLPDTVVGDPTRVGQILTNLISNALKFTDEGHVTLRVEAGAPPEGHVASPDESTWVAFRVADTGDGIPEDQQERIFGRFNRAPSASEKAREGTGLGLAIVKALINQMDGQIDLQSTPGNGSVFVVRFPFATDGAESQWESGRISKGTDAQGGAGAPSDEREDSLNGTHLLVVDDNATNQVVVRDLLQGWGAVVDVADDGVEALARLDETPYDLVLMDVQMPRLDGLEATRRLRREQGNDVPVIALTASMLPENRQEAFAAGMDAFVPKPFAPDLLHDTVLQHLGRGTAEAAPDALIDLSFLYENMGGAEAAWDVATTFRDQADAFVDDLAAARDVGDDERLGDLFHSMKSAAQLVGAERLGRLAQALDRTDPPYPSDRLDAIAEAARDTLAALDEHIEDVDTG